MDKPVRKIIRLDNYDYSKNGLYFITICTVHKNELLWATDVGDGAPDVPLCCAHAVGKVYLSSFGKIIRDNIHRANSVYDDKKILQYVIMPNHIHFILKIGAGVSGTSRALLLSSEDSLFEGAVPYKRDSSTVCVNVEKIYK